MSKEIIKQYTLGDMQVRYLLDTESNQVDFVFYPSKMEAEAKHVKFSRGDSLVQMKLAGDPYPGAYASGTTMRNALSTFLLKYDYQEMKEDEGKQIIKTYLKDDRGYLVCHRLTWYIGELSFEVNTTFTNNSKEEVTLEMLSSFSIGEITPFQEGDAADTLLLHRLRSKWSHEGRLDTVSLEDLQLEPSWSFWSVNSERFGQVGSMPVKNFFPFMALEDSKHKVFWGVQLAHEASWQMEVYRRDEGVHLSGGLADREFGHWMKNIGSLESFTTPTAILSVCQGSGIEDITYRLVQAGEKAVNEGPKSEQELPVLFNEYCTTWGCPSHENITNILKTIKGRGFTYFVIDCGWFKPDDAPWDQSMGDYEISKTLFPDGLEKTVAAIREAGMKPGIWFEIENVARAAKAFYEEEHLLKRDGRVLATDNRRFWDMKDPWVINYLEEKVIKMLQKYGFEYLKIDYNDTIGLGCDGAESLGEGLRQNIEASLKFIEKIKKDVPGIVIENCASGGHRLEPCMMRMTSMASFSDSHECEEIPIIAANLHRAILPRQSQIWAVIRKTDSLKRISFSIANTFLGRMCLSGDVTELDEEKWEVIDSGIEFYKRIAPIIKEGFSHRFGTRITSERHPKGWQAVLRVGENKQAYVVIHTFDGELPEYIEFILPKNCPSTIESIYSDSKVDVSIEVSADGRKLRYKTTEAMKAVGIYLI